MSNIDESGLISAVYSSFLELPSREPEIQKQIFSYGTRVGNNELLAKLAKIEDLLPELDDALKDVPAGIVKAAWASKKDRADAEIISLVSKEKRVKVLQALAEREDLPELVYRTIAEKSNGIGSLSALISNNVVSLEVKGIAMTGLLKEFGESSTPERGAYDNRAQQLSNLLANAPELATLVSEQSGNMGALYASARTAHLTLEGQKNILNVLKTAIVYTENKTRSAYDKLSIGHFVFLANFVELLTNHGPIHKEVESDYIEMIKSVQDRYNDTTNNSYYSKHLAEAITLIKKSRDKQVVNFQEKIANVNSISDMDKVIEEIIAHWEKNRQATITEQASLSVIASQYSNGEHLNKLLHESSLSWYNLRGIRKLTEDAGKIGVLISHYPWVGVDSILSSHAHPETVLMEAIKGSIKNGNHISQEIINSKFLTEKIAFQLPLTAFLAENTPIFVRNYLANILKSTLSTTEEWITFESLGREYQGSIADLLLMIKNI